MKIDRRRSATVGSSRTLNSVPWWATDTGRPPFATVALSCETSPPMAQHTRTPRRLSQRMYLPVFVFSRWFRICGREAAANSSIDCFPSFCRQREARLPSRLCARCRCRAPFTLAPRGATSRALWEGGAPVPSPPLPCSPPLSYGHDPRETVSANPFLRRRGLRSGRPA